MLRKVIFTIDDIECFIRIYMEEKDNTREEAEIFINKLDFSRKLKATLTYSRDNKGLEHYLLIDENGNKCNINDENKFNGYERSVLNGCYGYFSEWLYTGKNPDKYPHGIINAEYVEEEK